MRADINGIIAEIAKKIETEGRDAIFASFEYTDSIGLGIDGADVWVALDSQQDGADGGWNSTALCKAHTDMPEGRNIESSEYDR